MSFKSFIGKKPKMDSGVAKILKATKQQSRNEAVDFAFYQRSENTKSYNKAPANKK